MKSRSKRVGRGFTLVEMLVVIVIIGILVSILVPSIAVVQRNMKNTVITVEMDQLSSALESYKLEYGDYPPDFTNLKAVDNHIARAWPRLGRNRQRLLTWLANPPDDDTRPSPTRLDPAEALVFWLFMLSDNPRNPFENVAEFQGSAIFREQLGLLGGSDDPRGDKTYYDFNAEQFVDIDGDGWLEYASKHTQGVPFVYFDGRVQNSANGGPSVCAYAWAVYPAPWSPPFPNTNTQFRRPGAVGRDLNDYPLPLPAVGFDFGAVRPYRSNMAVTPDQAFTFPSPPVSPGNPTQWHDAKKFQILCPGLDGHFGIDNLVDHGLVWKQFPQPNYYNASVVGADFAQDYDNLGNFGEKTLGASMP